jgi:hypothetical protein
LCHGIAPFRNAKGKQNAMLARSSEGTMIGGNSSVYEIFSVSLGNGKGKRAEFSAHA